MFRYLLNVFVVIFSGYSFVVCGASKDALDRARVVLVKGRPCTLLASFPDVSLTVTIPGRTALGIALGGRSRSGAIWRQVGAPYDGGEDASSAALPSFMQPPFNGGSLKLVAGMRGDLASGDTSVSDASSGDGSFSDMPSPGVIPEQADKLHSMNILFESLLRDANSGNQDAQYELANTYKVNKMVGEALRWYLSAAKQGHTEAMYKAALIYADTSCSDGIVDMKQAELWVRKAAALGHAKAINLLAILDQKDEVPIEISAMKAVVRALGRLENGCALSMISAMPHAKTPSNEDLIAMLYAGGVSCCCCDQLD